MNNAYDVIRTLIRTEKGTLLESERKYLFEVSKNATKVSIKKSIEDIYKVKVQDVNTFIVPGKKREFDKRLEEHQTGKKAVVTLESGQKIEVT